MITRKIWIVCLAFSIAGSLSCKKYLDKKSDNTFVTPTSIKDLQGLLDHPTTMNLQTIAFGETSSDDYFLSLATYNSLGVLERNGYYWAVDLYNHPNDWANAYNSVFNANFCIEQIDKIEQTQQNRVEWENVKGSAHFYRAYHYLNLAWVFAKTYEASTASSLPGIVLREGTDFNKPSTRATVEQTYQQIIKDLYQCIAFLPEQPVHVMRPSKAAGYGLLSRVWLSMQRYDSAFKYADLSLQLKNDLLDYNNTSFVTASANIPFKPFNQEIIFYATMSHNFMAKTPGVALIDTMLFEWYNSNDLRKKVFFRSSGGYQQFKGSYAADQILLFSGIAVDEIYLIRAECNARAGRINEALSDINLLMSKRFTTGTFVPFVSADQTAVRDHILLERRKELLMRGIRWSDIKRLNSGGASIIPTRVIGADTFRLQKNDSRYALPIPTDVIQLSGIEQN